MDLNWPDGVVPATERSIVFLQGMLDRMATSYSTYGPAKEAFPDKVDALASLKKRIDKYKETRNKEWLMDVANFAMIEFMHPSIEGAFYKPTEAKDSPGRKWHGEGFKKDRNDGLR